MFSTLIRRVIATLVFSLVVQASTAASLAFWNFENTTSAGSISTSQALSVSTGVISAYASQTQRIAGSSLALMHLVQWP